jgi:hypothetical protein
MLKKAVLTLGFFCLGSSFCSADPPTPDKLDTVFNPYIGNFDFVLKIASTNVSVPILDDGTLLGSATWFNFTGSGCSPSIAGGTVTINCTGGTGGTPSLSVGTGSAVAFHEVSSPTSHINFATGAFLVTLPAGNTAFVRLDFSSVTAQGLLQDSPISTEDWNLMNSTGMTVDGALSADTGTIVPGLLASSNNWTGSQTFTSSSTFESLMQVSTGMLITGRVVMEGGMLVLDGTPTPNLYFHGTIGRSRINPTRQMRFEVGTDVQIVYSDDNVTIGDDVVFDPTTVYEVELEGDVQIGGTADGNVSIGNFNPSSPPSSLVDVLGGSLTVRGADAGIIIRDGGGLKVGTGTQGLVHISTDSNIARPILKITTGTLNIFEVNKASITIGRNVYITDLTDCDTIDTDSNGQLVCGSDDSGSGGTDLGFRTVFTTNAVTNTDGTDTPHAFIISTGTLQPGTTIYVSSGTINQLFIDSVTVNQSIVIAPDDGAGFINGLYFLGSPGTKIYSDSADVIKFRSADGEIFRITSGELLMLDAFRSIAGTVGSPAVVISEAGTGFSSLGHTSVRYLGMLAGGKEVAGLHKTNRMSIGAITPKYSLHVGSTASTGIFAASSDTVKFAVDGTSTSVNNTFVATSGLRFETLTSEDCLGTDGSGNVQSGTCGGGGGGSSLAVGTGSAVAVTEISSPTSIINFSSGAFFVEATGGSTAYVRLDFSSITAQGLITDHPITAADWNTAFSTNNSDHEDFKAWFASDTVRDNQLQVFEITGTVKLDAIAVDTPTLVLKSEWNNAKSTNVNVTAFNLHVTTGDVFDFDLTNATETLRASVLSSTNGIANDDVSGVINESTNPVDWTRLKNVPAGFADGTDDGAGGGADNFGSHVTTRPIVMTGQSINYSTGMSVGTSDFALISISSANMTNAAFRISTGPGITSSLLEVRKTSFTINISTVYLNGTLVINDPTDDPNLPTIIDGEIELNTIDWETYMSTAGQIVISTGSVQGHESSNARYDSIVLSSNSFGVENVNSSTAVVKLKFNKTYMPMQARLPGDNPCVISNSTDSWSPYLLCDESINERVVYNDVLFQFSGSTFNVDVQYSMATDAIGDVVIVSSISCITPGDAVDPDANAGDGVFGKLHTGTSVTDTIPGTIGNIGVATVGPIDDTCSEGDIFSLYVERMGANAADDASGDIEIRSVKLYEP